jgi:nucleotide-binding universal stress UspA family protein
MPEFKRILVVSRMVQSSKMVIQAGISLARKYNAKLFIIHSVHNPFALKGWNFGHLSLHNEYEKILLDAKATLLALVDTDKANGVSVSELVSDDEPTDAILKVIASERIDLLVLLVHNGDSVENIIFNHSNYILTREMPCSIKLIKEDDYVFMNMINLIN